MANTTAAVYSPSANLANTYLDLGNGTWAPVVATIPALNAKAAKVKAANITLSGTAGTVTTITLPAGVYAFSIRAILANATTYYATGADTVAAAALTATTIAAADFGVGAAVYSGDTVYAVNPEGNTTLKLVSNTNSATLVLSLFIAG